MTEMPQRFRRDYLDFDLFLGRLGGRAFPAGRLGKFRPEVSAFLLVV